MEKKVADKIRSEETMAQCWRLLDSTMLLYNGMTQFAQDLLADISVLKKIQYTDYKRLFEDYLLLRTIIKEAKKAVLLSVLLIPVNNGIIEQAIPAREVELWRGRQSRSAIDNHAEAFVEFVGLREDWAL
jgi:hypothetical protein